MSLSTLQQLLLQVLQANELNGISPYQIVAPPKKGSTWSFGTPQFDVGNNTTAYNLLADILLNATDSSGNYIVDPSDTQNRGTVSNITDPTVAQLMADAAAGSKTALSKANQAIVNAALSSTYGMQQVLAAMVTQLNTLLGYASKVGKAASSGNQAFATSNVAQLFFADFANQYGTVAQKNLLNFVKTGTGNGVTASGPLGVGNLLNFYFSTSFSRQHAGIVPESFGERREPSLSIIMAARHFDAIEQ